MQVLNNIQWKKLYNKSNKMVNNVSNFQSNMTQGQSNYLTPNKIVKINGILDQQTRT